MFEAGFFGTIEDLFLGAKEGVENFGRSIGEKNVCTKSNSDDESSDNSKLTFTKEEIESAEDITRNCIRVFKKRGYEMYDLMEDILSKGEESMFVLEGSAAIKILSQKNGVDRYSTLFKEEYGVSEISTSKVMEIIKKNKWLYDTIFKVGEKEATINNSDFMKGLQKNPLQYFEMPDDVKNIIADIDSGKITPEKGFEMLKQLARVDNITITIDAQKMIWDYLRKRQDGAIADSTEKDDNSGRLLLDKVNKQPSEIKVQFQDALARAKTAALEEIQCFEEMAAFAKKKSEGRLTQADLEEMEKKLPVWKQCLVKAKDHVAELLMTGNPEADNSEVEKSEITFEDFEDALHYAKEQISSL